jgi:hypothetical protein
VTALTLAVASPAARSASPHLNSFFVIVNLSGASMDLPLGAASGSFQHRWILWLNDSAADTCTSFYHQADVKPNEGRIKPNERLPYKESGTSQLKNER